MALRGAIRKKLGAKAKPRVELECWGERRGPAAVRLMRSPRLQAGDQPQRPQQRYQLGEAPWLCTTRITNWSSVQLTLTVKRPADPVFYSSVQVRVLDGDKLVGGV
jgi:hypothetical protein